MDATGENSVSQGYDQWFYLTSVCSSGPSLDPFGTFEEDDSLGPVDGRGKESKAGCIKSD